ncbi:hypothetical protein UA75_29920 [Actinoalloteichus sp. GBA129-24]|uniref:Uncharacterized protein n=1 Tax=Actinoalloteichus fjordicus TaxID=1612552 RepID=A0AAC9PVA6_9PSEU|nr:hypothetical protein UA74_29390 [Actinoalloteichus fjordicus]APU23948.1 hypothetical protein UA75_29920 [Actinoalloteichus sp. GBA129-24]
MGRCPVIGLVALALALIAAGIPLTVCGYRTPRPARSRTVSAVSILARCAAEAASVPAGFRPAWRMQVVAGRR